MKRLLPIPLAFALSICTAHANEHPTIKTYNQASANTFLAEAEKSLSDLSEYTSHASLAATYINIDSQAVEARASKEYTLKAVQYAAQVKHWDNAELNATTRRKLDALRAGITLPSPNNEELATELAQIGSKMQSMYGQGEVCDTNGTCLNLTDISHILATY